MMKNGLKRQRLSTCVKTILEVHSALNHEAASDDLIGNFEKLEDSINSAELKDVSDSDILRVEEAANRLLNDLKQLYSSENGMIYEKMRTH